MWSGQCTDDCKQKVVREKRQALVATPKSSFDVVVSPESAMPSPDVLVATPLFASSSRIVADVASSRTSMVDNDPVDTQCVDPSSLLGYTPPSDHSYHQATTSAPPAPPGSPRAVTQQGSQSASGAGAGSVCQHHRRFGGLQELSGSAPSFHLTTVTVWPYRMRRPRLTTKTMRDEDEEAEQEPQQIVVEEQQQSDDDDNDDENEDEKIDVNTIRCTGRLPKVIMGGVSSAPASPTVVLRMTSSGSVVTPSHKARSPTARRSTWGGDARPSWQPPPALSLAASASGPAIITTTTCRRRTLHRASARGEMTPPRPLQVRLRSRRDGAAATTRHRRQLSPSAKRSRQRMMERKRRDDMRVAFQELREKVPSLADNKKATMATILDEAANYANQLAFDECRYDQEKKQEKQHHEVLKQQLAVLQQQGARHPYEA